ncbi:DNA polymerase III subunit gamma/tau [Lactobacillus johnsonii]|jgi:DNA polymerase-3 subunit gamma/tau|uniref:DNA-directed DNA polymerase n=1 Tax=Lactobacillus johnsonii ATCC 33200 TaxID=525330 RepID=C2E2Y2_LACJH|nr:DNA polymerase III subunit gamma/tau [Lactobacillus johnsonii]EEJ60692.1 DNA polymerase III, subunit gamma and tau [Lactobacillus johnsonii ATCC 33200]KRK54915.1 DNA-directed DNA polymerase [Lactobacillus johnsonii ATCC 33200]MBW8460551.1 DNA polymerase III subunit gamma/tau [Lactobacillus johnsonii]MCF0084696.1 DNA polymerase III subunit gamma/tau [Lactobacillus johnsonii]MCL5442780.1 DNA polymerase III subunit gamma/tau [Lactobacillus johnsonii]
MAYQALYRKWRPRTFDGVVGQTAITDTLKNAIKRGKISHAFLFAGPRGTGKTSCAKIFAKALNCTNLQDGEPCNECENCLAADQGTMNDIIEIDAASNNGVDEIRDIRDKVKYAPTQGKYKVYIIDEVHMLSMGAFNALLKTLEEPPEHVVFILATTELQKVPATIISRTQRYNFKRIDQHDLIARMTYILGQEKIDFEEKALEVIAQVADGGMRDSLSILDQILSYDQDKVKYEDALRITGYAAQEKIEQVLLNLLNGETSAALEIVHALLQDGASTKNILDELISLTVKGMLAIRSNKEETFLTEDYVSELTKIPEEKFYSLVQAANNALNDLRYTNQQQIPLDVFVVQVTQAPVKVDNAPQQAEAISSDVVQTLKNQIDTLSKQIAELKNRPAPARSTTSDFSGTIKTETRSQIRRVVDKENKPEQKPKRRKASSNNQAAQENNRRQVYHVLENATKEDLNTVKDIWPDLLSTLKVSQRAVMEVLDPVAASHEQIVLKCKYELWFERANQDGDLISQLEAEIAKLTKHNYSIVLVADSSWLKVRHDFVASHKEELLAKKFQRLEKSEQEANGNQIDPQAKKEVIDKAKELFGDLAQVKD